MKKRSVTLKGHRTSVTLEPQFWAALDGILAAKNISLQKLVEDIDDRRGDANLSSSLRVFILENYDRR